MRLRSALLALILLPASSEAQQWAVGVASGPFVFGNFAESQARISNQLETIKVEYALSADTSAGLVVGVERFFNDRLSIRLEGTAVRAPLALKSAREDEDATRIGLGDMDGFTLALPVTFRFNRGGRFRPFLAAGPAGAAYDFKPEQNTRSVPLFDGTRIRAGAIAGAGVEWWINNRWLIRGEVSDILTKSPLKLSDFSGPPPPQAEISTPNNIHTTVGASYRF